jgi:hypothetical protein
VSNDETSSMAVPRVEVYESTFIRPASSFEKSSTSLMIDSSACGAAPDGLGIVALLALSSRVEQEARHPDHAVHGRADLVAHVGEELGLRPSARRAPRRAPGRARPSAPPAGGLLLGTRARQLELFGVGPLALLRTHQVVDVGGGAEPFDDLAALVTDGPHAPMNQR